MSGLLILSGCSSYQENFHCPMEKGEQCKSLHDVNNLADTGKYARETKKENTSLSVSMQKMPRRAVVYYPGTNQRMVG